MYRPSFYAFYDFYVTVYAPDHQLTSCEAKICMFVRNKSIIKMFLISNCCFWIKYESIITLPPVVIWSESGEKSAQIKHRLQDKTVQTTLLVDFDVRDNRRWTSLLEKVLLWTLLMLDLFLRNTQLLSSPDVN